MTDNPQEYLAYTIEYTKHTFELIKHQDHHYHIYLNGVHTDAVFPRHRDFYQDMKYYKVYDQIIWGKSMHNRKIITKFFMNVIPEHFL